MDTKRALLYVAYGHRYIKIVQNAIRNSNLPPYPIYLITDHESEVTEEDLFHKVLRINFKRKGHLRKSEFVQMLPKEDLTFLYLDSDTHILGDITLGFDKAEQHGMSLTMAPVYSMEYLDVFKSIMKEEGVQPSGRVMYNAGVIFFHLNDRTRRVLQCYADLCDRHGDKTENDQFYLNLAFEKLNFNPYMLSPSYNYRGLGDLICDEIRIWHSWEKIPKGINQLHPKFAWVYKDRKIKRVYLRRISRITKIRWRLVSLLKKVSFLKRLSNSDSIKPSQ